MRALHGSQDGRRHEICACPPARTLQGFIRALSPNSRFPIELPDARHFILEFQYADRTHHLADSDFGVIRPEDAAILVFVVAKTHSVTVGLPERFSVPQL